MKPGRADRGGVSLVVERADGSEVRLLTITSARLRRLVAGTGLLFVAFALLIGSWWFLAARAGEAGPLAARVGDLESELVRVDELAQALVEAEAAYENLRSLFGPARNPGVPSFLPPAGGRSSGAVTVAEQTWMPSSWPLTERGFLTQPLLEGGGTGEEHPGIDIAVPSGSYIRAAGGGIVADVGDDSVYGRFVILDHGDGYRSLYAHASRLTVERGEVVKRNQVIGLSGSSGRSTAPHLHFEILRNGEPIDPMELVERP